MRRLTDPAADPLLPRAPPKRRSFRAALRNLSIDRRHPYTSRCSRRGNLAVQRGRPLLPVGRYKNDVGPTMENSSGASRNVGARASRGDASSRCSISIASFFTRVAEARNGPHSLLLALEGSSCRRSSVKAAASMVREEGRNGEAKRGADGCRRPTHRDHRCAASRPVQLAVHLSVCHTLP
jgi:hypothetical protein